MLEQQRVRHREDRGVSPDPDGDRQCRHEGKEGLAPKEPCCVPHVTRHVFQPGEPTRSADQLI
jgi:hypothetical protein